MPHRNMPTAILCGTPPIYKNLAVFATLALFLLLVSEIADPCCALFLGHKSVPDTAFRRSHGA